MTQTRLIIVDDDSIIRLDLRDLLTQMGYEVAGEAPDAQTAITLAREIKPDLVIMDIRMPGGPDGIDAAATLTQEKVAPVLLLTAFSDLELVRRAAEAGVVGYLLKPFSEDELRPTIEITLARFHEFQILAQESQDLREQLETRKLVERAKGVLMAQFKLSEAEAFRRIQKASMDTRRPMKAIAEAILLSSQVGA
jgi:AmiR/NasT family two-component response regulator